MADAASIEACRCGGQGGLESFEMDTSNRQPEIRWRVRCAACGSMTVHSYDPDIAILLWNQRAPRVNPHATE